MNGDVEKVADEAETIKEEEINGDEMKEKEEEETDDEYRLRVYGGKGGSEAEECARGDGRGKDLGAHPHPSPPPARPRPSLARQMSSKLSRGLVRRRSSFVDSLPDTPSGWALLGTSIASAALQYEVRLQESLTRPPDVYKQAHGSAAVDEVYRRLTTPTDEGILSRAVRPSMFVGTRGVMSSTAAYALGGPKKKGKRRLKFREIMTMAADGAKIAVDWEMPPMDALERDGAYECSLSPRPSPAERRNAVLRGTIDLPVVLVVHGLNNDTSFGYVRSVMRTCADRGWIGAGMNLRGQGGVGLVTPRGYNAGYTGDIRGVVQAIEARLAKTPGVARRKGGPIYIIGYSLGANLVTKYLGEEGLHGTLPQCVGGGAALGNPLHIHSGSIAFPWNVILGAGVKRSLLQNAPTLIRNSDPNYRSAMLRALLAPTIGRLDDAAAPHMIRNEPDPPYAARVGHDDGEAYWADASSHRCVAHVSVPLLKISARDDFLVFGQFQRKLTHMLENPNVVVVKTKCGGHLGWQESPPPVKKSGRGGVSTGSWSDAAVADFIEALLQIRAEEQERDALRRRDDEEEAEEENGEEGAEEERNDGGGRPSSTRRGGENEKGEILNGSENGWGIERADVGNAVGAGGRGRDGGGRERDRGSVDFSVTSAPPKIMSLL